MSEILSQYFQRSPRYILLPQDQCLIRVSGPKQTPWEEGTEIKDISNSGLSFTAPNIILPRMGESIRVQFDVPGSQSMACYAKVIRIEKNMNDNSLIAIQFESLNSVQQWNLSRGLKRKKTTENNVISINRGGLSPAIPKWIELAFYASVGFSLFFSAFLLFSIYKFLADPNGLEKFIEVMKFLFLKIKD